MSGAVVGALVLAIRPQWLRAVAFVAGCLFFGVLASWISGELEESWGFLSVDMALVWIGGLVSVSLLAVLLNRVPAFRNVFRSSRDQRK